MDVTDLMSKDKRPGSNEYPHFNFVLRNSGVGKTNPQSWESAWWLPVGVRLGTDWEGEWRSLLRYQKCFLPRSWQTRNLESWFVRLLSVSHCFWVKNFLPDLLFLTSLGIADLPFDVQVTTPLSLAPDGRQASAACSSWAPGSCGTPVCTHVVHVVVFSC